MAATYFVIKAAPPDLPRDDPAVRLMYFGWVVELGLKRKDLELSQGLNAKGEPLPGVKAETRRHRKSAMTPAGKGDPRAPYLMPGRGLSRTRSLLAGKAHANYAEFWWRYSAQTGDQWGKVLAMHARRGEAYNVVGLSPKGQAWVAEQAFARWRRWKAGTLATPTTYTPQVAAAISIPLVGRTNLDFATEGIGGTIDQARKAIAEGRSSGFLSASEWDRYWRQSRPPVAPARPGTSYSVRKGASNVLLQHVWTPPPPAAAIEVKKAAMGPKTPPKAPRPASRPRPKPVEPEPVGPKVKVYGEVPEAMVRDVEAMIAGLPRHVRANLQDVGVEVALGGRMSDIFPADVIARSRLRGYGEGETLENTSGVYRTAQRQAAVALEYKHPATGEYIPDPRVDASVRHELGHAIDESFSLLSQDAAFEKAYAADSGGLSDFDRHYFGYFLQEGEAGPSEVWAELTAVELGSPLGTAGLPIAEKFPRCAAIVARFLREGLDAMGRLR